MRHCRMFTLFNPEMGWNEEFFTDVCVFVYVWLYICVYVYLYVGGLVCVIVYRQGHSVLYIQQLFI